MAGAGAPFVQELAAVLEGVLRQPTLP